VTTAVLPLEFASATRRPTLNILPGGGSNSPITTPTPRNSNAEFGDASRVPTHVPASTSYANATREPLPGYRITRLTIAPGGTNEQRPFNGVLEKLSPLTAATSAAAIAHVGGVRRVLRRNTKKFRPRKNKSRKHRN
jgi:hypothetical protein